MQTDTQTPTNTLTLDAPELSLSDYRTLREGRELAPSVDATPSDDTPADAVDADAAAADPANGGGSPNPEDSDKQDKKKKGEESLNFRFSELTGKIKTLEAQLAAKNTPPAVDPAKPAAEPAKPAAVTPDPSDPEPDPSKVSDYTEWQKSYIKWELRQNQRAEAARVKADANKAEAKNKADAWQAQVSEASKSEEMKDFATVAQNPDLPVTTTMAQAITSSEIGTKVLYHLGKNPDEAARIAKLSPVAQVRAIGKIEASLEASAAAAAAASESSTNKTVVSKAPAPIRPVGGGSGASSNPLKSIDTMSQAEYRAYRESGKLR